MTSTPTSPLLAVALLFRSKPQFAGIDHVVHAVSAFADSSVELPLATASRFGSVALLERIWSSSVDLEPGGRSLWSVRRLLRVYPLYNKLQFTLSLLAAVQANSVEVVRWLFERFPDYGVRRKVVYAAASAGALEILRFFRENGTTVHNDEEEQEEDGEWDEEKMNWERGRWVLWGGVDAAAAALAKHTDVVKWMYKSYDHEDRNDYKAIDAALITGDMELANWVMDRTGMNPEGHEAIFGAAVNGHVEPLQWFQDRGEYTSWDAGTLIKAAEAGQLNVVRWIIDRDRKDGELGNESGSDEYDIEYRFKDRARRTFLTCLGGEASLAIHAACINGHLDVAKYLHACIAMPLNRLEEYKEKDRLQKRISALAPRLGDDHNAAEVSGETMLRAAEKGFLDVVQWLYTEYHGDPRLDLFWVKGVADDEYGYSENEYSDNEQPYCSVVDVAAASGHLDIVQYLLQVENKVFKDSEDARAHKRRRTHKFPNSKTDDPSFFLVSSPEPPVERIEARCTTGAMNGAAANGHLNVVRWLHENRMEGCTVSAMDLAATNGHLAVVQWLHNNRNEGCTTDAIDDAARGGHLDVIKWLHAHRTEGCTAIAMNNAAAAGSLEVVKWLHENRSEGCTAAAMDGAAAYGKLDIVKWLHRNRSEGCTERAMDSAAHGGHLHALRWLFENRSEGFTAQATDNATRFGQFETVLILHNLAQQGLASEVDIMDDTASKLWVAERYHDIIVPLTTADKMGLS
ncbi:hypothetical protein PR003_g4817 [Phytophthora rubi]|uniref:Uncharacterized protein n=1 Tax=Phytophthora rubi TaxID=129364 RepID=A0A6A3NSS2_9STRA|nr:hypothetical protein PR002_g9184 [Phytophthora rubi]KAE9046230.1 hypothetical protein PR001_g4647 [Phytophthora rubi]KAE9351582.1 hypothetical protein PR003_g4817 [Phytophthora rubi]